MSKKVLIISSSLRGGSNSECLARECERGAKDAGHDVQFISLKGKELKFFIGCLSCQEIGKCVLKDDAADIMAAVYNAESLVANSNGELEVSNFEFSAEEASFGKSVVIAKGNEDLVAAVNEVVNKVTSDGSYQAAYDEAVALAATLGM